MSYEISSAKAAYYLATELKKPWDNATEAAYELGYIDADQRAVLLKLNPSNRDVDRQREFLVSKGVTP